MTSHIDNQTLVVQYARVGIYILMLLVCVGSFLFQPGFINWGLLGPFYSLIGLGFFAHLLQLSYASQLKKIKALAFSGFVVDSLILSALVYYSGSYQSLFLFLHLLNILVAGIAFQSSGAFILALITSIGFSVASLFGPEIKALQFFFLLVLNNVAFFTIAALSGFVSEQLMVVGQQLVRTGKSLQALKEFSRTIVENMPSGLVAISAEGIVLQTNNVARRIFANEKMEGMDFVQSYPTFPLREGRRDWQLKTAGQELTLGVVGQEIYSPEVNEKIRIFLVEDLTELRRLETQARQNEKLAAVGALAAGIAHEIRNPLAGISGSIELLSQQTSNDDDRKLMKIILREIDRLNNLITEFLDYSRPETPPTERVNVSHVLNEVLDSVTNHKNLNLQVIQNREIERDLYILAKADKLKQAFLNMTINAYQAMQDKPEGQLMVKAKWLGDVIQVVIRDTGSGMSEATKQRLFEPFHTTKPKGTGLGLAVTHKILETHRANILVESKLGEGTEFVLTFPAVKK